MPLDHRFLIWEHFENKQFNQMHENAERGIIMSGRGQVFITET